jgi:hypothetical protein
LHLRWTWSPRLFIALATAVLTAVVIVSPYFVPYSRARATLGPRPEHDLRSYSAALSDYLRPSVHNKVYAPVRRDDSDERSLFVGAVTTALALVGLTAVRNRQTAAWGLLTLVAIDLSLGVNGLLFDPLRQLLPFLDGLRAPARFGVFALLGAAVLAAFGVAWLLNRFRASAGRIATTVAIAALVVEYWMAPVMSYRVPVQPGALETWLAQQPRTTIAALPVPEADELWGYETVFQYLSIFHWQPMLNGYSGHAPASYLKFVERVSGFPSEDAVEMLRSGGVRLVIFMERYARPGQFDQFLYACHNTRWFSDLMVLADVGRGRSAVCWLATG